MTTQHAWQPLEPNKGHLIAICSNGGQELFYPSRDNPSVTVKRNNIRCFQDLMASWGIESYIADGYARTDAEGNYNSYFGWPNTPENRAQQIIDALKKPNVKAIFITGGWGAEEVVYFLQKHHQKHGLNNLPNCGIPMVGFSSATEIQHYLGALGVVSPIQGPTVGQLPDPSNDASMLSELKKLLFEGTLSDVTLLPINESAKTTSVTGTTTMYEHHDKRSSYRMVTNKQHANIMLMEDATANDFAQDIEWLARHGELDNIDAIILAICFENYGHATLENAKLERLKSVAKKLDIPVFFGAPFGHAQPERDLKTGRPLGPCSITFLPVPLHIPVTITSEQNSATMSYDNTAIRSSDNVGVIKKLQQKRKPFSATAQPQFDNNFQQFQGVKYKAINKKTSRTLPHIEHVLCPLRQRKGSDIAALDGFDTTGKHIMFNIHTMANYDPLNNPQTQKHFIQQTHMALMDMQKTNRLESVGSITIAAPHAFPEGFEDWLHDFAKEHLADTPVYTTVIPELQPNKDDKTLCAVTCQKIMVAEYKAPTQHTTVSTSPQRI